MSQSARAVGPRAVDKVGGGAPETPSQSSQSLEIIGLLGGSRLTGGVACP